MIRLTPPPSRQYALLVGFARRVCAREGSLFTQPQESRAPANEAGSKKAHQRLRLPAFWRPRRRPKLASPSHETPAPGPAALGSETRLPARARERDGIPPAGERERETGRESILSIQDDPFYSIEKEARCVVGQPLGEEKTTDERRAKNGKKKEKKRESRDLVLLIIRSEEDRTPQ